MSGSETKAAGADGNVFRDDSGEGAVGRARDRPLLIGLTGPIGCGKTTVAAWLREAGGAVIDADELARLVTAPGEPALAAIRARFGPTVFKADGSLDRRALADVVFADPRALRDLESIVHPAVRRRLEAAVAEAEAVDAPFVVVEAIKLVEVGYASQCDEVWLIECRAGTQRQRLAARGVDPADADRRLTAQGPDLADRLASAATRRISTDGSVAETRAAVLDSLREAIGAARAASRPR
jgi:dephospho-CoA kinase